MKIYVCESGCRYEGGSVFYATIDYIDAWKACRKLRVAEFNHWSNYIDGQKYRRKKDAAYINYKHVNKNYWVGNTDYVAIKIYEVPPEVVYKFLEKDYGIELTNA